MRPGYASAVMGPAHAVAGDEAIEGFFDDIGRGLSNAVKFVGHAASDVVHTAENVGKGIAHGVSDVAKEIGKDASVIEHGLMDAAKHVKDLGIVLHLAQIGVSFIPGIGQGVSAAIGAGLALAEGKPITDALLEGIKGALPGGPIVGKALEVGIRGAADLASGKRLDAVALDALRSNLPGGDLAKQAFDTGLALAQAKNVQAMGIANAGKLVPHDPMAMSAFAMTRRLQHGRSPKGAAHAAMRRLVAIRQLSLPVARRAVATAPAWAPAAELVAARMRDEMMRPTYGAGYAPIGDLADFFDPFGIRKIPGKIKQKVDNYVQEKAQTAANVAEKRLETNLTKAVRTTEKEALAFVAGGVVIGAIWGGITFYRRSREGR